MMKNDTAILHKKELLAMKWGSVLKKWKTGAKKE